VTCGEGQFFLVQEKKVPTKTQQKKHRTLANLPGRVFAGRVGGGGGGGGGSARYRRVK